MKFDSKDYKIVSRVNDVLEHEVEEPMEIQWIDKEEKTGYIDADKVWIALYELSNLVMLKEEHIEDLKREQNGFRPEDEYGSDM